MFRHTLCHIKWLTHDWNLSMHFRWEGQEADNWSYKKFCLNMNTLKLAHKFQTVFRSDKTIQCTFLFSPKECTEVVEDYSSCNDPEFLGNDKKIAQFCRHRSRKNYTSAPLPMVSDKDWFCSFCSKIMDGTEDCGGGALNVSSSWLVIGVMRSIDIHYLIAF